MKEEKGFIVRVGMKELGAVRRTANPYKTAPSGLPYNKCLWTDCARCTGCDPKENQKMK